MDVLDNWCKRLETSLLRLDNIPQLGNAPAFPWEECAQKFSEVFDNTPCQIMPQEWQWRFENELLDEFPSNTRVIELSAAPIKGPVYFAMEVSSIERMVSRLMSGRNNAKIPLPQMKEAFTTFILLESIHTVGTFPSMKGLSPKLIHPMTTPKGSCLSRDIHIQCDQIQQNCRLLLSEEFVSGVEKHFQPFKSPLSLHSSDVADTLELILNINVGKTELSQEDWNAIEPGDFLRLDSCTLDPESNTGTCSVCTEGNPLFKAKVSSKGLEITSA